MAAPIRGTLLVVEDERTAAELMRKLLEASGFRVLLAANGREALDRLAEEVVDVIITDLVMPVMSGQELVEHVQGLTDPPPIFVATAHGTVDVGRDLAQKGVAGFLTKPIRTEELQFYVEKAIDERSRREALRVLSGQVKGRASLDGVVGESPEMQTVLRLVLKIARSNATVLLRGESGTGKELIARAVHRHSRRAANPFQAINCAAIPETLLESELFGYERGAFTGADRRKIGLFEAASGSTLFLDEIGDLSPSLQGKILRALQQKEIRRIGGTETIPVDARIVAATNRDLEQMIAEGRFREDLYYRLNIIPIVLPPLRRRPADIPILAEAFLRRACREHGKEISGFRPEALELLGRYSWPGNVRELESFVERAVLLTESPEIGLEDLPPEVRREPAAPGGARLEIPPEGIDIEQVERDLLVQAMEKSGWVIAKAARLLRLTYRTMQYRLEKFGIRRPEAGGAPQVPPTT